MGKSSAKKQRNVIPIDFGFRDIKPLNYIQETYLQAIHNNDIIFGIGSAGTG